MPQKKKKTQPRKSTPKKLGFFKRRQAAIRAFMQRRPHRSFRLTRRRDYTRSLNLPGYMAFGKQVFLQLWLHKRLFISVGIFYALIGILLGNMASQSMYDGIREQFRDVSEGVFEGSVAAIGQAMLLSLTTINGASQQLTEVQQVYAVMLFLLVWLTTVWLLRELLAGGKPRMRDGVYSALSPLVSTFLVLIVLLVQLIPIGLLLIAYSALAGINVITNGFGAFLFGMIALLIVTMTLYWVTSTFIALIVVTLPGMYPMQALRTAGDLVIGRRLRILYRLLWLGLSIALPWFVIMTPAVLIDGWLRDTLAWYGVVPLVPLIAAVLGALTTVWASSYIYLLYRKVVDDDSAPA